MTFKDPAAFEDPDLHLIYRAKHYIVPAANYELGRYLHKVYAVGAKVATDQEITDQEKASLTDEEEEDFMTRCLGEELLAQVAADNVPFKVISAMAQTLLIDTVAGREKAEAFWASGGKAQAPKAPRTGTRTRKAAASTTQKQASRSGTKPAAKAKATSGRTSSGTGES